MNLDGPDSCLTRGGVGVMERCAEPTRTGGGEVMRYVEDVARARVGVMVLVTLAVRGGEANLSLADVAKFAVVIKSADTRLSLSPSFVLSAPGSDQLSPSSATLAAWS
eukprot:2176750-Amphidinium_carterae.1